MVASRRSARDPRFLPVVSPAPAAATERRGRATLDPSRSGCRHPPVVWLGYGLQSLGQRCGTRGCDGTLSYCRIVTYAALVFDPSLDSPWTLSERSERRQPR